MVFDVDCAIGIMNHIINNQKVEDGKLNIFYCKHFYETDKLKKYDKDIIYYAILMLHQGGYIDAKINRLANNKQKIDSVKGLTLRGHEFCEHMKEPTVSKRVKNGFKAIGKHSLHYAETVIQECLVASTAEATKMILNGNLPT